MLFSSASVTIIALFLSLVNAHASLNPPVSRASYSQSNLRVPHGCNGSDTVSVEVSIPVGLSSVKPQKVAGFVMTISKRPLAVPITSESGASIIDEVDKITWAQGSLPDSEYQDFGISFKLPPSTDGTVFYFPVLQTCVGGAFNNWSMVPTGTGAKLSYPAPSLTVMANGTLAKASDMTGSSSSNLGSKNGATTSSKGIVGALSFLALFLSFL